MAQMTEDEILERHRRVVANDKAAERDAIALRFAVTQAGNAVSRDPAWLQQTMGTAYVLADAFLAERDRQHAQKA